MSNIDIFRPSRPNIQLQCPKLASLLRRRIRRGVVFIYGSEQTGKKTLAQRFSTMDQGPFTSDAPSMYEYTARIDLDTRETNGTGDVILRTFVIPPERDLPVTDANSYSREMNNISAIIFLISVIDKISYSYIKRKISFLKEGMYQNGLPYFFVVGNKMDLDRTNYPDSFTFYDAFAEVGIEFGVAYVECSAKENIEVDVILEKILRRVITDEP